MPGFPLDGGRVLRSIVWGATGNLPRATRIASYVGQAVAFGMIAWGVSRLLGGDVFGGLWTAFIGWFLEQWRGSIAPAADGARCVGRSARHCDDGYVTGRRRTLSQRAGLRIRTHSATRPPRTAVVESGRLLGIVSITDAKHLAQGEWATTPVSEVMTRMPLRLSGLKLT